MTECTRADCQRVVAVGRQDGGRGGSSRPTRRTGPVRTAGTTDRADTAPARRRVAVALVLVVVVVVVALGLVVVVVVGVCPGGGAYGAHVPPMMLTCAALSAVPGDRNPTLCRP